LHLSGIDALVITDRQGCKVFEESVMAINFKLNPRWRLDPEVDRMGREWVGWDDTKSANVNFEQNRGIREVDLPKNPDVLRFPKLLRFSTIGPVKAGWLHKKSGTWTVTDEGKTALQEFPDPEAFFRESIRLYRKWKASQPD
jgi:hypothetical protein